MEEPSSALENQGANSNPTPSGTLYLVFACLFVQKIYIAKEKKLGLFICLVN